MAVALSRADAAFEGISKLNICLTFNSRFILRVTTIGIIGISSPSFNPSSFSHHQSSGNYLNIDFNVFSKKLKTLICILDGQGTRRASLDDSVKFIPMSHRISEISVAYLSNVSSIQKHHVIVLVDCHIQFVEARCAQNSSVKGGYSWSKSSSVEEKNFH